MYSLSQPKKRYFLLARLLGAFMSAPKAALRLMQKYARKKEKGRADTKVLIVEDNAANILVVTTMLEHLGYMSDVATCGAEALQKVLARTAPYMAIFMDVQMQDMTGFEATRQIRELEKDKSFSHFIIGVTAHALVGDRARCIESGMNDYMSKPLHLDLLAEKLGLLSTGNKHFSH